MLRRSLAFPLGAALLLAGCPAPSSSPTPAVSPAASPSAAPTEAPSVAPTVTPTPVAEQVMLSGRVYNDEGEVLENAEVVVESTDAPQVAGTIKALGGVYTLTGVPAGAVVTLTAKAEGMTARTIVHRAAVRGDEVNDPNRRDFGGSGDGMFYALSEFPEIVAITPAHKATGVEANPLAITFRFSHPFEGDNRQLFERLVRVKFPIPGSAGEKELFKGTEYDGEVAAFTWNEAGTEATFRFAAPIVTRAGDESALTIVFDDTADEDLWPKATNGKRLGMKRVADTRTGGGGLVQNRVAPILRTTFEEKVPEKLAPASEIWAKTHQTTSVFSLAKNPAAPKVVSVEALRGGTGGAGDRLIVTFDRPMRGFPKEALDGSAIQAGNYRYVLGKVDRTDDRERFEAADPKTSGGSPGKAPTYHSTKNNVVTLLLDDNALRDYTRFKLYVDSAVKDITGTNLEANQVIEGTIQ